MNLDYELIRNVLAFAFFGIPIFAVLRGITKPDGHYGEEVIIRNTWFAVIFLLILVLVFGG